MKPETLTSNTSSRGVTAQFHFHQSAPAIQHCGTVSLTPIELDEPVRLEMAEQLNLLLADTMTMRDLYKKAHWQISGPTFYQLHRIFDKHFNEQAALIGPIAEPIQTLGCVSLAMVADVAETTRLDRPPRDREMVPVQISRLIDGHEVIIGNTRKFSLRATELGDDGTNDLLISHVLWTNEMQAWFLSKHLANVPFVEVKV